jgi:hypothetical protein
MLLLQDIDPLLVSLARKKGFKKWPQNIKHPPPYILKVGIQNKVWLWDIDPCWFLWLEGKEGIQNIMNTEYWVF